jgi:ABC-type polysaccharide/polyol phosphate export permease
MGDPGGASGAAAATPGLRIRDAAAVPGGPDPATLYRHRPRLLASVGEVWARREIVLTLAERDIRAAYKEATLGVAWALLSPVATLVVMTLVFSRVKLFHVGSVPYVLFAYVGILSWQFFASAVASGSSSLLANKGLLSKVHFPRECFPLSQVVEAAVNTGFALTVLAILYALHHFAPRVQALWIPLILPVELAFTVGVVLATSALLVHVRDLTQVVPIVMQIGMFASPVVWPLSRVPAAWRPLYGFADPVAPVIDSIRRTMLMGQSPDWGLLGIGALGALVVLVGGYAVFKRLEADLGDIA